VVIALALWMARGYTLSGMPFYPSNAFRVEADWSVPRQVADEEALWISGWARAPNVNAHQVVGNWNWFHPWFLRITGTSSSVAGIFFNGIVYPLTFGTTATALSIVLTIMVRAKRKSQVGLAPFLLILPAATGLVYWFVMAPDPRFARSLFWIFPLAPCLVLVSVARRLLRRQLYLTAVSLIFFGLNLLLIRSIISIIRHPELRNISTSGVRPPKAVPLIQRQTVSGLNIYVPSGWEEGADECGDSPLPCTPYFNPNLRLRKSDMSSGFTVKQPK
jgi:hypothetical protein